MSHELTRLLLLDGPHRPQKNHAFLLHGSLLSLTLLSFTILSHIEDPHYSLNQGTRINSYLVLLPYAFLFLAQALVVHLDRRQRPLRTKTEEKILLFLGHLGYQYTTWPLRINKFRDVLWGALSAEPQIPIVATRISFEYNLGIACAPLVLSWGLAYYHRANASVRTSILKAGIGSFLGEFAWTAIFWLFPFNSSTSYTAGILCGLSEALPQAIANEWNTFFGKDRDLKKFLGKYLAYTFAGMFWQWSFVMQGMGNFEEDSAHFLKVMYTAWILDNSVALGNAVAMTLSSCITYEAGFFQRAKQDMGLQRQVEFIDPTISLPVATTHRTYQQPSRY